MKGLVDITITSERRNLREIILLLGDVKKNRTKRIFQTFLLYRKTKPIPSYIGKIFNALRFLLRFAAFQDDFQCDVLQEDITRSADSSGTVGLS